MNVGLTFGRSQPVDLGIGKATFSDDSVVLNSEALKSGVNMLKVGNGTYNCPRSSSSYVCSLQSLRSPSKGQRDLRYSS